MHFWVIPKGIESCWKEEGSMVMVLDEMSLIYTDCLAEGGNIHLN